MKFTKCADGTYHDDTRRLWLKPHKTERERIAHRNKERDWDIVIDNLVVAVVRGTVKMAHERGRLLFETYTQKGLTNAVPDVRSDDAQPGPCPGGPA